MAGLLAQVEHESTLFPREEIRFGVVLNGGVSLAVWMGGAVMELDHLTKAGYQPDVAGHRTIPAGEVGVSPTSTRRC